jgi:hypothetical protein
MGSLRGPRNLTIEVILTTVFIVYNLSMAKITNKSLFIRKMLCNLKVIPPLSPNIVYRVICPTYVAIVCPFSIVQSARKCLH